MNKLQTLLLATTLIASPFAFADHDGMGGHCERMGGTGYFSDADKNKDGVLDKAEFQAMQEKHFDEMDTNHDGKLSKDEKQSHMHGQGWGMHERGTRGFTKADKDNSGTLTKDEAKVLPRVSQHFDEIDVDKDGTVDRDEVHNYMKDHPAK